MKLLPFGIDGMKNAREELDKGLATAMHLMRQKGCLEGHVSLAIDMTLEPETSDSWVPEIKYKVSINVPVKLSAGGKEELAQIVWDGKRMEYMAAISGEQLRID